MENMKKYYLKIPTSRLNPINDDTSNFEVQLLETEIAELVSQLKDKTKNLYTV